MGGVFFLEKFPKLNPQFWVSTNTLRVPTVTRLAHWAFPFSPDARITLHRFSPPREPTVSGISIFWGFMLAGSQVCRRFSHTHMHTHTRGHTYIHARMNTQNQSAASETKTNYFRGKRSLLRSVSLLAFPLYSPVGTDLCPMKCFMYVCMHNFMLSSLLDLDSHLTT